MSENPRQWNYGRTKKERAVRCLVALRHDELKLKNNEQLRANRKVANQPLAQSRPSQDDTPSSTCNEGEAHAQELRRSRSSKSAKMFRKDGKPVEMEPGTQPGSEPGEDEEHLTHAGEA